MDKATGGAAFPDPGRAQSAKQRTHLTETGMTLRDYFAAQALPALVGQGVLSTYIGKAAYEIADAMLAERAA